jgi:hypothetical protein
LKQLYKLLVEVARLDTGVPAILVKYGGKRPALDLSQTANKAPCPVLALVAVQQQRVSAGVQQNLQRVANHLRVGRRR